MRSDILIALTAALAAAVVFAQAPVPAIGPGSTVAAVALRADGAIIVAGTTQGSQGGQSSQGGLDAFIAWLTPEGLLERVLQFGTSGDERVGSLILDEQGNIYVTGDTNMQLSFAVGTGAQFVVKFTPEGQLLWAKNFGGNESYSPPVIALDGAGDVIVAGSQPSGRTKSYGRLGQQPFYEAYLAVLTLDGELIDDHVFTVDETQAPTEALPLSDGSLVILGLQSLELLAAMARSHTVSLPA